MKCCQPVLDPEFGASKDAPVIHPDLENYEHPNFIFPVAGTNIANHFKIRKGDTEAAWPQCAAIVEQTFRIPHVQHVPIEPHVAIAKAEENGQVTLWASTQSPFAQRGLAGQNAAHPRKRFPRHRPVDWWRLWLQGRRDHGGAFRWRWPSS